MRASWETVMRRTLLIAQSDCSPAEYRRMVKEKAEAVAASSLALIANGGKASVSSLLMPWYRRANANAKRLRKR
jgi:hypothetical protein